MERWQVRHRGVPLGAAKLRSGIGARAFRTAFRLMSGLVPGGAKRIPLSPDHPSPKMLGPGRSRLASALIGVKNGSH